MRHVTNSDKVRNFMLAFGQKTPDIPGLPDKETVKLRLELIQEEVRELKDGIDKSNLVDIVDALCDILYVTYGAGHAFGIDLDDPFNDVHNSNMSKLDKDGKPIYREDGKVMKGPDYKPPNLAQFVWGPYEKARNEKIDSVVKEQNYLKKSVENLDF